MVFCDPVGHRQERGDYQESWQPTAMSAQALKDAQAMAKAVVDSQNFENKMLKAYIKDWPSEQEPSGADSVK